MDWNRIEGNWKEFKGQLKEKWGKLTDDDLDQINGRRAQVSPHLCDPEGTGECHVLA